MSRAQYILSSAYAFTLVMRDAVSLHNLINFAEAAEEIAREKSRQFTQDILGDERALTDHADHMRTLGGKIRYLRDTLVPQLSKEPRNILIHGLGVYEMASIRAYFEAMDSRLN